MTISTYAFLKEGLESAKGQTQIAKAKELLGVADDLGTSLAKLAIAWCLTNPHVSTVILGASRASQLTENLEALDVVPQLTPDVLERIETIVANKPELPTQF